MKDKTNWISSPLEKVASITMGQSPDSKFYTDEEIGLPFLQGSSEFQAYFPVPTQYCIQIKKVAKSGSILISVRAPVGETNIADQDYIIGRGLAGILGTNINQSYLEHYIKFVQKDLQVIAQGSTFEAIKSEELKRWVINYPIDDGEQAKIAEILSLVDEAIQQTEAIIEKQERIKTGLMQDLLQYGIDEDGNIRSEETHEFKNSPLGRIPVEWEVCSLASIKEFVTSGSRGWAKYYDVEGAKFLRIGNLTRLHIHMDLDNLIFVNLPEQAEGTRSLLQAGDLLVSVTADLGIIGVIPDNFGEAYINQHIALVRLVAGSVNPQFIGWFLTSRQGQEQFEKLNESGAKAGLNLTAVQSVLVPDIDPDEQNKIANILNNITFSIHQNNQNLKKLNAIKQGLMQDLLTGDKSVVDLLGDE